MYIYLRNRKNLGKLAESIKVEIHIIYIANIHAYINDEGLVGLKFGKSAKKSIVV